MAKVHMQALAITVALLVLLVALPSLAEPRAFDPQELSVDTLNAGMPLDSVIASIGAPGDRQTTEEAATGSLLTTCQYEGLTLTFTDDALTGADWTGVRYIGPRGLRTGDTQQTVLSAFQVDASTALPGVLYTSGWVDALSAQMPPCGVATDDGAGNLVFRFEAPMQPYSEDVQADPASYVYQTHASLTITVDSATQTVSRIQWQVGAFAE